MSSDSWTVLSSSSRRYQSRSDLYHGGEEFDVDEEYRPEFICPFCADDFDIVGLCCHIEEDHAVEFKNGVCPVCAKRDHVQRKRRFRRGGSNSTFSILRKELREGNLQSLLGGGSSCLVPVSNAEPDPLLSSFICNSHVADEPPSVEPNYSARACSVKESLVGDSSKRNFQEAPLSEKDQEEKARKCEYVQGLLLSTFLDDVL